MTDDTSLLMGIGMIFLILFGLFLAVLWALLPFAVFGIKHKLDCLIDEQRKTNEWLKYIAEKNNQ